VPGIGHLFEPLEEAISTQLIPSLIGRPITSEERKMIALPVHYGGLCIQNLVLTCDREFSYSKQITSPLVELILQEQLSLENLSKKHIKEIKANLKNEKEEEYKKQYEAVCADASTKLKRCLAIAKEKGNSALLTALPLNSLGYCLNKSEFQHSIHVRYNCKIAGLPSQCACGERNNTDHALTCKKGGYSILRHNAICRTEAIII
jgi:hypothetical protein